MNRHSMYFKFLDLSLPGKYDTGCSFSIFTYIYIYIYIFLTLSLSLYLPFFSFLSWSVFLSSSLFLGPFSLSFYVYPSISIFLCPTLSSLSLFFLFTFIHFFFLSIPLPQFVSPSLFLKVLDISCNTLNNKTL